MNDQKLKKSRRVFLKKIAYNAPKIIVLGQLSIPVTGLADGSGGPPPPPTDWNLGGN